MEEQAVGEDAIRAEEDLIRRRREKDRQNQANNGKNKTNKSNLFGDKITVKLPWENDSPKGPLKPDDPRFSNLCEIRNEEFLLKNELVFDLEAVDKKKNSRTNDASHNVKKYDIQWLEETLKTYYTGSNTPLHGDMAVPEFALVLVQLLSTKRSSDDLQAELFDLVGFERIELIELLLNHREDIADSYTKCKQTMRQEIANAAASVKQLEGPARPNYGCQVIVQSQEEKALQKLARKEEKRINKLLSKTGNDSESEGELDQNEAYDPVFLRTKRQEALASAMVKPLFSEKDGSKAAIYPTVPRYPFVFDSLAKTRTAPGFIQGVKMSLPIGFEREDTKKFERVSIPADEKPPVNIGRKLVPISELDIVGKTVFQGINSLNRIQSIVFDAAYRTSENLLVCAPTGAGKTNVALLCIVQTIRQHMDKDVIKKDTFKIVYVAPMKALAAEMTTNFSKKLAPLGITVRELTGDMQLTKSEIMQTQVLVTTPEKWDVVTRKPGDVSLAQLVRLLIIDEIHLLHGDRGPVIESLVARTLRLVESSQTVIRIVGLSATLPNYIDVTTFLRVNPELGLFFFDGRFRPVPLAQTFIGIKNNKFPQCEADMDDTCYDKIVDFARKGKQIMVFVHARNATVKTAMALLEKARNKGQTGLFEPDGEEITGSQVGQARKLMSKSRNNQLVELFQAGFGIHHAGMLRSDRNLVESLFGKGHIKVLCCTATLAWGVNLPAHAVIIKGTEIYKNGKFEDVGILDVLQIFGRAGRPQFDTSGNGTIITKHDKLSHYLSLLTNQFPIESNFIALLGDNLNAEISLGTVTSVSEAVEWLSYTYLFVRMRKNPLVYGIKHVELRDDPTLEMKRREIIIDAARKLDKARMIRFDERTEILSATDMGRTASHYYVKYDTIEVFNAEIKEVMNEADILATLSKAQEFEQLKSREEEMEELDHMTGEYCEVPVAGGSENVYGKVNILIQTHISRGRPNAFSLVSDSAYVITNASRIARALFEIVLRKNWPLLSGRLLRFAKTIERQMWDFENPLRQHPIIKPEILDKLERRNFTIEKLRELESDEIGRLITHQKAGKDVKRAAHEIPLVEIDASIQPITRTILRVRLTITPNFTWNDRVHGKGSEPFWIWVEDPDNNYIYHHEYFTLAKRQVQREEPQELVFTIPIFEPLPSQYYARCISDRWIGSETYCAISFQHLILPEQHPPHTNLLDLQPLPITALGDAKYQELFTSKGFSHFNPIQTQIFHTLYHTDENVLLGAPTGSGKTIAAEIAMFKVFRDDPIDGKVVYIAPLKALVRERISDWKERLERRLGKNVVELTGDVTPDMRAIQKAHVIVTTPEKWDGISRSWQTRNYVQAVRLIVIDEIHLLGEDRGPVLEVIVSRTNFISSHTSRNLRIIGLSTALANAKDLADWLGIKTTSGLFNFRPSVRPVPLEVHISGHSGKHYCPRMATMNKPTYQAIQQYSPGKPTLIFVSSRRQTRLTALDLIAFLAAEDNPKMWLKMDESEMERISETIKDQNLRLTLAFGIGMHHAGLVERDRQTVEELFVNQKIQVLIATATVAWGVNFPAHLVVIKGTEYYDGKQKRYVDMPITDVLQMMGRAGRPQFDDEGVACVLVHDVKKNFYKKFLYEPFPVESSLLAVLPDHLNAEIVAGTITSRKDALDYMTWTYFFRRLLQNPSYYGLEGVEEFNINSFLTSIVDKTLHTLAESYCVDFLEDETGALSGEVEATTLGRIASYYYLSHETVAQFKDSLQPTMTAEEVLSVLCYANEYDQLPVRHNEDLMNADLAKECPINVEEKCMPMESPHTKAHLLLQAHFSRLQLPCSDYYTDLKSVLDQAIRIIQAMIDVAAEAGWLATTVRIQTLLQMVVQGRWVSESSLLCLPHIEPFMARRIETATKHQVECLPELIAYCGGNYEKLARHLRPDVEESSIEAVFQVLERLPRLSINASLLNCNSNEEDAQIHASAAIKSHKIELNMGPHQNQNSGWTRVNSDTDYTLCLQLNQLHLESKTSSYRNRKTNHTEKAYAPR